MGFFSDAFAQIAANRQAAGLDPNDLSAYTFASQPTGPITKVVNGVPYDANNNVVNTSGSAFTDPATGQIYTAGGEAVDMSAYAQTPPMPSDWKGDFWSWINHLSDIGAINQDYNTGGLGNLIRSNGYMIPLLAAGAFGGLAASGLAAGEAGLGAGALETTGAGGLAGGGSFVPAAGSGASFSIIPEAAYTTGAGLAPSASGFGLNAGAPTVGAASPSGIAATQSAAGLGGSGTGIIEGLAPTSVGMGGTTGAGSLTGIAGSEAAAGLGGANLGTGLTASQLAQYEAATPSSITSSNLSNASKLAKALTSQASSQLSNATQNFSTGQTGIGQQIPALIRGNQNPFVMTQNQPIQNTKLDLSALAELLKQG